MPWFSEVKYPLQSSFISTILINCRKEYSGSVAKSMYCLKPLHDFYLVKNRTIGINTLNQTIFTCLFFRQISPIPYGGFTQEKVQAPQPLLYASQQIFYRAYMNVLGSGQHFEKRVDLYIRIQQKLKFSFSVLVPNKIKQITDYKLNFMCIDDYQFRNYQAKRNKVYRRFVVINQDDITHTYFVDISQFQQADGTLAFCKILIYLARRGLTIHQKKFYIPKFHSIVQPYTFCRIKFQALDETSLIMKSYPACKDTNQILAQNTQLNEVTPALQTKETPSQTYFFTHFANVEESMDFSEIFQCNHSMEQPLLLEEPLPQQLLKIQEKCNTQVQENYSKGGNIFKSEIDVNNKIIKQKTLAEPHKRTKQPERVIGEVILLVKIWRQLHEIKKWSLITAAKLIGISKKTLDDYYLVLRVAQIHNFDYQGHLSSKMGDLRGFIRKQALKVTGKLGKEVNIFKEVPEVDLDAVIHQFNDNQDKEQG